MGSPHARSSTFVRGLEINFQAGTNKEGATHQPDVAKGNGENRVTRGTNEPKNKSDEEEREIQYSMLEIKYMITLAVGVAYK
jgi:hypothetical protein